MHILGDPPPPPPPHCLAGERYNHKKWLNPKQCTCITHGINYIALQEPSNGVTLYQVKNKVASNLDSFRFLFCILFCALLLCLVFLFQGLSFSSISPVSSVSIIVIHWKRKPHIRFQIISFDKNSQTSSLPNTKCHRTYSFVYFSLLNFFYTCSSLTDRIMSIGVHVGGKGGTDVWQSSKCFLHCPFSKAKQQQKRRKKWEVAALHLQVAGQWLPSISPSKFCARWLSALFVQHTALTHTAVFVTFQKATGHWQTKQQQNKSHSWKYKLCK